MGQNLRRKGLTDVNQISTKIWEKHGALSCAKEIVSICHLSTMHERDRQTDRQTDHGTVTSMAIGEIAFRRNFLMKPLRLRADQSLFLTLLIECCKCEQISPRRTQYNTTLVRQRPHSWKRRQKQHRDEFCQWNLMHDAAFLSVYYFQLFQLVNTHGFYAYQFASYNTTHSARFTFSDQISYLSKSHP